jgi:hypothetical protein
MDTGHIEHVMEVMVVVVGAVVADTVAAPRTRLVRRDETPRLSPWGVTGHDFDDGRGGGAVKVAVVEVRGRGRILRDDAVGETVPGVVTGGFRRDVIMKGDGARQLRVVASLRKVRMGSGTDDALLRRLRVSLDCKTRTVCSDGGRS